MPHLSARHFLYAFGAYFLSLFAAYVFASLLFRSSISYTVSVSIVLSLIFFLYVIWTYPPFARFLSPVFLVPRFSGSFAVLFISLFSLLAFAGHVYFPADTRYFSSGSLLENALFFVAVGIMGPIQEELFFRGYVYRFLHQHTDKWVAAVLSSLGFSLMHADADYFFFYLAAGLCHVALFEKTKSIWYPIAFHISWNCFVLLGFS